MMANSSDWVAALARESADAEPDKTPASWIDALIGSSTARKCGFVEGFPIAAGKAPADMFDPDPDPQSGAPAPESPEGAPLDLEDPVAQAFADGEAAGRAAAAAAQHTQREAERSLRLSFRALDQAAIDSLASELAETVIALCGQAIEGFVPDADSLAARCEVAAQRLGSAGEGCSLHLHPDDLALLAPDLLEQWQVEPDSSVERGGLRFEGADGAISDSPADWRRAIAAAIRG